MQGRALKKSELKPTALLREVRRSVSEILNKPFTESVNHQIFKPDQKVLALWAVDCAEHVLPFFEAKYSEDVRPRKAIMVLRNWITTSVFSMGVVRKASLDAHASAKGKKETDAILAAHSAGQAAATAHVATHAFGSSVYGIRAVVAHTGNAENGARELKWQLRRLKKHVSTREKSLADDPTTS